MAVKSLFDPDLAQEIKERVANLHPESARQWGDMDAVQILAHCTCGLEMAMGVINPKRAPFPANVLGLMIKPLVFGDDKPMRQRSPSAPELFRERSMVGGFEEERAHLIATIDHFVARGAAVCSQHPHPFFGRLKPQQWAILMYKHLDHHLRQFNA
jgi:hypothetical protein